MATKQGTINVPYNPLPVLGSTDKCKGPSEHSALCSEHFTFESTSVLSKKIGLKMNQMIKPDAILTFFSRPAPNTSTKLKQLCKSVAYNKRERAKVTYSNY